MSLLSKHVLTLLVEWGFWHSLCSKTYLQTKKYPPQTPTQQQITLDPKKVVLKHFYSTFFFFQTRNVLVFPLFRGVLGGGEKAKEGEGQGWWVDKAEEEKEEERTRTKKNLSRTKGVPNTKSQRRNAWQPSCPAQRPLPAVYWHKKTHTHMYTHIHTHSGAWRWLLGSSASVSTNAFFSTTTVSAGFYKSTFLSRLVKHKQWEPKTQLWKNTDVKINHRSFLSFFVGFFFSTFSKNEPSVRVIFDIRPEIEGGESRS